DLVPAVGDLGEGRVPGDALPAAAALGPDAPQRVQQPVRVVNVVEVGADLGAQPAAGHGVVGVAADADGPAVLDLGDEAAGVRTAVGAGAEDGEVVAHGGPWRGRFVG